MADWVVCDAGAAAETLPPSLSTAYAAWLTNSVGLWSDAMESTVNLVAALVAELARLGVSTIDGRDH